MSFDGRPLAVRNAKSLFSSVPKAAQTAASSSMPSLGASNTSRKFIAIGIDFGTTFSGASWAYSEDPDEIKVVRNWPCQHHQSKDEDQVPTQYNIATDSWGYEITSDMTPMKWFKLLLLRPENMTEEIRNSEQLKAARALLARSPNITPEILIGMYLRKLWRHTLEQIKRYTTGVDNLPLKVGITIPAIWPPYAHKSMREAAAQAGILDHRDIGETTLDLVQEPEAAGLATLFYREQKDYPEIEAGESFVVCDAGGGTVDIITYEVITKYPFKIKECVTGDGKLCGSFLVDDAFANHMRTSKKLRISSLSEPEYNDFVTLDWEYGAKRSFTGNETPKVFQLRLPAKAYGTFDRVRRKDGFALTRDQMVHFFGKSLSGIRTLIEDQRQAVEVITKKPPSRILLVGGLGSSDYIFNQLQKQFKNTVLKPLHPWSAVARGAVIRLIRDKLSIAKDTTPRQFNATRIMPEVISRKSRYSYGILSSTLVSTLSDFNPDLDEVTPDPYGKRRTERMDWYLRIGEEVSNKSPVRVPYVQWSQTPTTKEVFVIRTSDVNPPPARNDRNTVKSQYRIECNYDKPFSQWKPIAGSTGGWREYDDMAVTMLFDGGEPKWKIRMGGNTEERDAEVSYMPG